MDFQNILLFITSGANLGLAFFIITKDIRNKTNIWFSVLLTLIAAWSSEMALFRMSINEESASFWLSLFYLTAILIGTTFSFFAWYFPHQERKMSVKRFSSVIIATITGIMVVYSGTVNNIFLDSSGNHSVSLFFRNYVIYSLIFIGLVSHGSAHLLRKFRAAVGYSKKLIGIVFVATLLSAIAGVVFDLILPLSTYKYISIGPYFTLVMVFIIVRYVFIKKPE